VQELPEGPYLRQLEELDLSFNFFRKLPPCLGTAITLRRICFSSNPYLEIY
jgi:Leucine-rich repeat (LRR) protein